jgi:POT family proton-dependent oligopeptide transporter
MSILGGLLADGYLGKYRTIFWLSLVYVAGDACLALFNTNYELFMLGLLLITLGAGGIKPCVSANVGDQFGKSNQHLITKMFGWFYFAINAGSMLSTVLTPVIKNHFGPFWAFGVPGMLMFFATFIFWLGRKKYVRVPPKPFTRVNFINISFYALFHSGQKKKGESLLDVAKNSFPEKAVEDIKSVWRVLAVFAFIPVYWALYDQNGSEWVLQAQTIASYGGTKMNLGFTSINWLPEQIQVINPVLILVFIPLFSYIIYPGIEKLGIKVTSLRKIGAGFVLTAVTFIFIAILQARIDAGLHPGIGLQILAYVTITASEILVSITGLEYAYSQAPPSMKSTIMSFWLMTVFVGDFVVSLINANIASKGFMSRFTGQNFYWFFFGVVCVTTIIYFLVSGKFKETSYLVADEVEVESQILTEEHP